ncbi:M1 family metallopeptidase [Clostridioides difficile]|nr:M1 family metallopeptidase [Clostridioides difficile]
MQSIKFIKDEIKRLFSSKITWAFILIITLVPVISIIIYEMSKALPHGSSEQVFSLSISILIKPAKLGALIGTVLFSMFTIYEMDSIYRNKTNGIIETIMDAKSINLARVISIIISAIVAIIISMIICFPYSIIKMGENFSLNIYMINYLILMLPAILFSILFSAGFYSITRRIDLSLIMILILVFLSMNIKDSYLIDWVQTKVTIYSSSFGNALSLRTLYWNRLLWSFVSISIYLVGVMCTRKYEKNIFSSILINVKKIPLLVLTIVVIAGSYSIYALEPYYDDSPPIKMENVTDKKSGSSVVMATRAEEKLNKNIKLLDSILNLKVNPKKASLDGKVEYTMENISGKEQKLDFDLNPGYNIEYIKINGKKVEFDISKKKQATNRFSINTTKDKKLKIEIKYGGKLINDQLFQDVLMGDVISREKVILSNSSVFPKPKIDIMNTMESMVHGSIILPTGITPITSGISTEKIKVDKNNNECTWKFNTQGTKLTIIAADYVRKDIQAGGIKTQFYYNKKDESKINKLNAEKIIKDSINFYTKYYGELDSYKVIPLKIVEGGASSGMFSGGKAYENISYIDENVFNSNTFDNLGEGSNGAEVLAHEICHQWWGIIVQLDQMVPPWSAEGITNYATNKFMEYEYGKEYSKKSIDNWKKENDMLNRNFYMNNPQYLEKLPENYVFNILSPNSMRLLYNKMPLQLLKAEEILGEDKFENILKDLYNKYKYNILKYDDFLKACNLTEEELNLE